MNTPTLTEARRALLELLQDCPAWQIIKLNTVSAYLDSLIPLNIENNALTATVVKPVEYNEIVRPFSAAEASKLPANFILMETHRDPLPADSNRVFFATSQERDEFAVRLNDRLNAEVMSVDLKTPGPLGLLNTPVGCQPSFNDVINTVMGAGPRGEMHMSERYTVTPPVCCQTHGDTRQHDHCGCGYCK